MKQKLHSNKLSTPLNISHESDPDGDQFDNDVDKVEYDQAGDAYPLADGRCLHIGAIHVNILQEVFKTHLKESRVN